MALSVSKENFNDLNPRAFGRSADPEQMLITLIRVDDQPLQDLKRTPAPAGEILCLGA